MSKKVESIPPNASQHLKTFYYRRQYFKVYSKHLMHLFFCAVKFGKTIIYDVTCTFKFEMHI